MAADRFDGDAGAMLDALPERVVRYRLPDLTIIYCNVSWARYYGIEPDQAIGHALTEFLSPSAKAGLAAQLGRLSADAPILSDEEIRSESRDDGQWFEWVDQYIVTPTGAEIVAVGRDVTKRHNAELKLAESETRFRDLADNAVDVVWRFVEQPEPHLDYVSPSVENTLGYPPSYFMDDFEQFLDVLDDSGRRMIEMAIKGEQLPDEFDLHFRNVNGEVRIGATLTTPVAGGVQGISRDVTELRRLQDELTALALRDPLTGLANRRLFNELLDAQLARLQRSGEPLAVAFLDLDGLKRVNDEYGHDAGDIVLCETARRLNAVVRDADVVARLGGDEFVIAFEPNAVDADELVHRIDAALSLPIELNATVSVRCPASIGVADTHRVGPHAGALLAAADEAMYASKRLRRNR